MYEIGTHISQTKQAPAVRKWECTQTKPKAHVCV